MYAGKSWCHLYVATMKGAAIVYVSKDDDWWINSKPILIQFWKQHICPEIVDKSLNKTQIRKEPVIW
jgi:hypothetical protein